VTNTEKKVTFADLWLSEATLQALEKKWFVHPSPIQEQTIPLLLKGTGDIIWQAATWTWKTAAFWIPMIEKIEPNAWYVQALVLAPTRELANQVAEEIKSFQWTKRIQICTIYGGQPYDRQIKDLKRWVDIVVWTPWRVIDHIKRKTLVLDKIKYFVLDEADEMLNMGFLDDIKEVLSTANPEAQKLLFSATMPRAIIEVAKTYMKDYDIVQVKNKELTKASITQYYFDVHYADKLEIIRRIVHSEPDIYGIVFCNMKREVSELVELLQSHGYKVDWLHWDMQQAQRQRVLDRFKKKKITILFATDVAARWIDVDDLTHVINHSLPQDPEQYVHRIGRTWRAGKEWIAISLVTRSDRWKLNYITRLTKATIEKGEVPSIEQLVAIKKNDLKVSLEDIIENNHHTPYEVMAEELLHNTDPKMLVASLLRHWYHSQLSSSEYKQLTSVGGGHDSRQGGGRDWGSRFWSRDWGSRDSGVSDSWDQNLFVALWRSRFPSVQDLVKHLEQETGIPSRNMQNVRMKDDFSFIELPAEQAEQMIYHYKKIDKRKPLVTKAKPRR